MCGCIHAVSTSMRSVERWTGQCLLISVENGLIGVPPVLEFKGEFTRNCNHRKQVPLPCQDIQHSDVPIRCMLQVLA